MNVLASPAQIALSTVAAGWPIAAGMGFIVWSSLRRRREAADEAAAPARLASVIEALDAQEELGARLSAQRRQRSSAMPQH